MKAKHSAMLAYSAFAGLLVLLFSSAFATAGETSWVDTFKSKVRLVTAEERQIDGEKVLMAGIQVRLERGWKTYWRYPGDAGLPPSFKWDGSQNVKAARVLWPAPVRLEDPYGSSIGYHDEVVFPIAITPVDKSKPARLQVDLGFAVCKDICAPASAKLAVELTPGARAKRRNEALVSSFLETVPARPKAGREGPSLAKIDIDLSKPKPKIDVDAEFPGGDRQGDLFVEGPEGVLIPMSERKGPTPEGKTRFTVDLTKGDDPAMLRGKQLIFTLVSPGGNSEITHVVD